MTVKDQPIRNIHLFIIFCVLCHFATGFHKVFSLSRFSGAFNSLRHLRNKAVLVKSLSSLSSSSTSSSTQTDMANPLKNVRVTSYNVLSTQLAGADYFQACDPKWLDPQHRLRKLKEKLDVEVANNAIICLQEVSNQCASTLHPYFIKNDYYFMTTHYGSRFNGYMGVGIAIPLRVYNIENMDITRVSDTKRTVRPPSPSIFQKLFSHFFLNPFLSVLKTLGLFKKQFNPWEDALKRFNQMICVRLSPRTNTNNSTTRSNTNYSSNNGNGNNNSNNHSFVVGTYHMPCMFDYPAVMMIHCSLSAQNIQRFAKNDPFIYTGDFNIKPTDSMYELLTKGEVDAKNPHLPKNDAGDDWSIKVSPMRSAYALKNKGVEPEFTNFAKVKDQTPFIGTLDYIFLSSHWKVNKIKELPKLQGFPGPLPIENEPSDHLLISAEVGVV